jgi:F-type H+-transporting ATPase subunit delta
MASRMQVAAYVADKLGSDRAGAVRSAAAWLTARGQGRQARYLARDVAQVLATHGYVLAHVTTARSLSEGAVRAITEFIMSATGAKQIELEQRVDPTLIGGIQLEIPGRSLDASVRTKLAQYVAKAGGETENKMEATT